MNEPKPLRVAILLPRRERFAQSGAGAVSTVVDGFACHSRFRTSLKGLGAKVTEPLHGAAFVPVPLAPFWQGGKTRRYLVGAARLLKNTADIVEIHNRPKYVPFLRKALPSAALVLYLHNDPRTMKGTKTPEQRRQIGEQVQAVFCVSNYIRHCFLEGLDALAPKTFVVPNAIDAQTLKPPPEHDKKREIMFAGRTIADKGPHLLVEAAEKLLPAYPDWKIVIVGGRHFGAGKAEAYEKELFQRVKRLGPQGEVTGYVPRQEVLKRLQQAAIAVLPSLWEEPMPMVTMEAAACGCAVITTRRGGIPEGMGDAALYLPEETPEAVEALLRELMDNPEVLRAWQQKARAHIVQNGDLRLAAPHLDGCRQKVHESFVSTRA